MHVHFESSHLTPDHYASVVVPQGTTTIFFDPHELANVFGLAGVRYSIEASRGLPLSFMCAAPSSVPSAPGLETTGAEIHGAGMAEMLSWTEVAGVAEVMDMAGVLSQSRRMKEIVSAGLASGKLVEGHARGLSGARLQAYMAAGVSSDHEITSAEDVIEKLRAGMTVELRGSHDHLLPAIIAAINTLPWIPSTLTICTDDVPPDYLVENGGLSDVLRRLIRYGMDPVYAIRCATLNASHRLRRSDLGLLAAGRIADIAVLSNLREIAIDRVFVAGRLTAHDGKMAEPVRHVPVEPPANPQALPPLTRDDCRIRIPGVNSGRVRIRVIKGARFTSWSELDVDVADGFAELPPGYALILVQQLSVLEDWGEPRGAVATTYSHDSHNLVIVGRSPEDMMAAGNALIRCGGGMAVAERGRITAIVEMPIGGLLSNEPPGPLAQSYAEARAAAGRVIEWKPPYLVFKALEGTCLACNPGPHLTDLGLTDGTTGQIVEILVAKY
jgi:adenine deaminase